MASGGVEEPAGQGNQYHVACVGGEAGEHPGKYHKKAELGGSSRADEASQEGPEKAGAFRNAEAQHGDEHGAKGCEAGEVPDRSLEHAADSGAVKEADCLDLGAGDGMDCRPAQGSA